MKIEGIKCDKCGVVHEINTERYFTVQGNIYIGQTGGLVGNNIVSNKEESIKEVRCSHYCHDCLFSILNEPLGIKHKRTDRPF